jgi:hypothetical protein
VNAPIVAVTPPALIVREPITHHVSRSTRKEKHEEPSMLVSSWKSPRAHTDIKDFI